MPFFWRSNKPRYLYSCLRRSSQRLKYFYYIYARHKKTQTHLYVSGTLALTLTLTLNSSTNTHQLHQTISKMYYFFLFSTTRNQGGDSSAVHNQLQTKQKRETKQEKRGKVHRELNTIGYDTVRHDTTRHDVRT